MQSIYLFIFILPCMDDTASFPRVYVCVYIYYNVIKNVLYT